MQIIDGTVYKTEIGNRLKLARNLIGEVIDEMESHYGWQTVHSKTGQAITQLKYATKLIVKYHLEICILKKNNQACSPFDYENMEEIIKTYKYLN